MKITGRTILITGGSAGIGLAFALKFLELGNQVIVTGRRQTVLDEVKAKYPKLHTIQGDVADPAQIASLATRVKAEYPRLDVLMNNAGIMLHKFSQPTREPSSTYPLASPSCRCRPRRSTVPPRRRFTPIPNRSGSSWRRPASR